MITITLLKYVLFLKTLASSKRPSDEDNFYILFEHVEIKWWRLIGMSDAGMRISDPSKLGEWGETYLVNQMDIFFFKRGQVEHILNMANLK